MSSPFISVLMTCFNREKYIAESIESVLLSDYTNFELVILDDRSTDRTVDIARSYEVKDRRIRVYVNEVNLGDYPNRNQAVRFAKGKYFLYVDSDDLIYSHSLGILVNAADKYPDAALYFPVRSIDKTIAGYQYLSPKEAYEIHFKENGFMETGPLGVLINKSIFQQIGGFSGKRMIGDVELWLKIAGKYPIVRLEKNMVFWRQHADQEFGAGLKYYLVDALQMYKDVLVNTESPLGLKEGRKYFLKIKRYKYYLLLRYLIKNRKIRETYNYYRAMNLV